jgi:Coenzyme PQQ synthesis protein D (PqqD)
MEAAKAMQEGSNPGSADATSPIADSTIISRSPSVLTAEVDGEIVMMSIEQGQYFGLDDIGSDIWKRLDSPCAFADLIDRLAADYDADRVSIAADVRSLLESMAARDVVRLG